MAERPKLVKIDPEMQRWCALLGEEISAWPDVSAKPMFGLTAFYHGESIFAALPRTRAAGTARSIIIKLPGVSDRRLNPASGPGSGWVAFELESSNDINEALLWLERAYEKNPG
ncbi:MAG TPA: luciferase family protein [Pyrinomonadaceae bacterium]